MFYYMTTYCSTVCIVGHFIPSGNKDPVCIEVQTWKVVINVVCGLLENTAVGVLVVEDPASGAVVKICPEWGNQISGPKQWKHFSYVITEWGVKAQMSIVVDLKAK